MSTLRAGNTLSHPAVATPKMPPTSAGDRWADLGIPPFLDRRPASERLGAPAISAGPDDDIGDIT